MYWHIRQKANHLNEAMAPSAGEEENYIYSEFCRFTTFVLSPIIIYQAEQGV